MMMREQRAKQFMPFDAMKGLKEAILEREERHSRVPRHGIPQEQADENSQVMRHVKKGCRVRLEYYKGFHDTDKEGTVTVVNLPMRYLKVDEEKILFEDIYSIVLFEDA